MKYARAPNGETVSFSDDHTDAEIMRYLATAPQYQPQQALSPPPPVQNTPSPQHGGLLDTIAGSGSEFLAHALPAMGQIYAGADDLNKSINPFNGILGMLAENQIQQAIGIKKYQTPKQVNEQMAQLGHQFDVSNPNGWEQFAGMAGGIAPQLTPLAPLTMAAQQRQEAIDKNEQMGQTGTLGGNLNVAGQTALGGLMGIIPFGKLGEGALKALPGALGKGAENFLSKTALDEAGNQVAKTGFDALAGGVGRVGVGAAGEGLGFGGLTAAQNALTKYSVDPNQDIMQGVPESIIQGGIFGAVHGGAHEIMAARMAAKVAADARQAAQDRIDEQDQLARQNQLREAAQAAQGNGAPPEPAQAEAPPPTPALEQTGQPTPQPSPIPEQGGPPPEQGAQPPPQQASAFDVSQLPPEFQQIVGGQGEEAPSGNPGTPSPQPVSTPAPALPTPPPEISQAPTPEPGQVITQPNTNGLSDIVDAVQNPKTPKMDGPSALEFISKNGGVNDVGGELSALDADKWHLGKPGKGKLIKDTGLSPDAMAQKLQDAGYIQTSDPTGQPTSQDLYDTVQRELAGQKIYTQTPENQVKSDLIQKYQAAQDQLTQMGLDPSRMKPEEIAHALTDPDGFVTSQEREPLEWSQQNPSTEAATPNVGTDNGGNSGPISPIDMASASGGSDFDIPFKAVRPINDIESELPSDIVSELAPKGKSVEVGDSIDAAPVMQKLKAELNRQGLGDVGIQLHDALWDETDPSRLVSGKIEQTPTGHIIHLATRIYDPNMSHEDLVNKLKSVMSHETVHAMRDLGVFKPADWNLLTRESMKRQLPDGKGSFYDKAVYDYAPRDKDGQLIDLNSLHPAEKAKIIDHIQEEAVAEMYRHFSDGNRRVNSVPTGLLNKMMNHMVRMVRAIGRSKADKLMESVRSGELTRRPLAPGQKMMPKDRYMMAYHGTRHLFKDFDIGKIGTGEGNQDYGWGLYFAQNKKVAEHYRQQEALPGTGRIYRVDIPDEKHMLDWDNSFDDHPKAVQKRIIKAIDSLGQEGNFDAEQLAQGLESGDLGHMTGKEIYQELTNLLKEHTGNYEDPDRAASLLLNENKIPGTKYLDQGSRDDYVPEKDRTRNYVVYHHDSVKVKGKEEQLGPRAPNWNENAERAHAQSALTLGSRDAANPDLDRTPIVLYTKDTKAGTQSGDPEGIHFFDKNKTNYRGFSSSTDPETASNWGGNYDDRGAVYPIHIFPKKIADFRNPEHLNEAVNYQIEKKYGPNAARDFADKGALETPESGLDANHNYTTRLGNLLNAAAAAKRPGEEHTELKKKLAESQQVQADIGYIHKVGGDLRDKFNDYADAQQDYQNVRKEKDNLIHKYYDMQDTGEAFDSPEGVEKYAHLNEELAKIDERVDVAFGGYNEAKLKLREAAAKHKEFLQTPVMDEVLKNLSDGYIPNNTRSNLLNQFHKKNDMLDNMKLLMELDGKNPTEILKDEDYKKVNKEVQDLVQAVGDPQSYRYEFYKIQDEFNKRIKEAKKSVPDGPLSNEDAQKYFPDIYNPMKKGDYSFWEDPEMLAKMSAQATYMKEHADDPKGALNVFVPEEHASIIKSVFNEGPWDLTNPYISLMAKRVESTVGGADSYVGPAQKGSYMPDLNDEIILRAYSLPGIYVRAAGGLGAALEHAPILGAKSPLRMLKYGISRESFEAGIQDWLTGTGDKNTPLILLYKRLFDNGAKNLDINNATVAASIAPQKAQAQILAFRRGAKLNLENKLKSQLGIKGNIDGLKKALGDSNVIDWLQRKFDDTGRAITKPAADLELIPSAYAYAKHALEYNEQGRTTMQKMLPDGSVHQSVSGMTDVEANNIIKYVEQTMSPIERDKILSIHQEMMGIAEHTRLDRIKYGLEPDYKKSREMLVTEKARLQSLLASESDPKKANEYQGQIDRFQKAIDKIPDYKYYVPLKSGEQAEHALYDSNGNPKGSGSDFSGGAKFNIRGSEDLSRTGRNTYAEQIIPNLLQMHENTIQRGFRNEVGNKLYNTIKEAYAAGDPDIAKVFGEPEQIPYEWKKKDDGSVELGPIAELTHPNEWFVTKINGIDYKVHIKTDQMRNALNGFLSKDTGRMASLMRMIDGFANAPFINGVAGGFSRLNHMVNAGMSPVFATRLFFKHTPLAMENAKAFGPEVSKSIGKYSNHYLWGLIRNDPAVLKELEDLRAKGGIMQPFHPGTTSNFQSDLHALQAHNGQLQTMLDSNLPWHVKMAKVNHGLEKAEKFLTSFTNKVEWTTRLAVNRAFLEHGATPEKAAYFAQDLTGNFARGGHATPSLSKLYPFYNAGVQSDNATISSMLRMGARGGARAVSMFVSRLVMFGLMSAVYNDFIGNMHKDDQGNNPYWMLNDNQRTGPSIPIFVPGSDIYYKQPNPFKLLSIPINFGSRLYATMSGHMNPWDMAMKTAGEFVGGTDHFESSPSADPRLSVVPGALRPVASTGFNLNWNGSKIHPATLGYPEPPHSTVVKRNTPEWAKAVAEGASRISGGDGYAKSGALEWYPDDIDYYAKALGGSAGDVVTKAWNAGADTLMPNHRAAQGKEPLAWTDLPIVSSLVGNVNQQQVENAFYTIGDRYAEMGKTQQRLNKEFKAGDQTASEKAAKYAKEDPDTYAKAPVYKQALAAITADKLDIHKIQANPQFTTDQKASMVKNIEDRIYLTQRQFISYALRGHSNNEPPSGMK